MNNQSKLVGREAELLRLKQIFQDISSLPSRIVFIAGEAGMGKTRLAEEALTNSEIASFTGRASEDATSAFGPIAMTFREAKRTQPQRAIQCGDLTPYLNILLPELGSPPEKVEPDSLTEAIALFLQCLSHHQPTILFLDDLHWADDATLELLPQLLDRLKNEPLLFLCTYRSDELPRGHRLRWLKNELRRHRQLQEIQLQALDQATCATILQEIIGCPASPTLVKTVFENTQGVPFFVEELAFTLTEHNAIQQNAAGQAVLRGDTVPIPESIRDAVLLRLDGLSEAARNQLELAAVAGQAFALNMLAELSSEEQGIDELLEKHLIIESGEVGAFRHALTREAVRSEIAWSQKRLLHRNIADWLTKHDGSAVQIGEHWLAANEHQKARESLLLAADNFCTLHAYRDAAKIAQRALKVWPINEHETDRVRALEQLAHCYQLTGQLAEAVQMYREVLESSLIKNDFYRLAVIQRSLATVYSVQGAWEQSLSARRAAAEAFEKDDALAESAIEWLAGARRFYGMYQQVNGLQFCEHALRLSEKIERWDLHARALALQGDMLSSLGRSEEGVATVRRGLALALEHDEPEAASEVYRRLGSALEYASQFPESREAYFTAFNYCNTQGASDQAQICLSCMSYTLFRTGDWKQCIELCREVLQDETAPAGSRATASSVLGLVQCYRGETRSAQKNFQNALQVGIRENIAPMQLIANWALALAHENTRDFAAVEQHYQQLLAVRESTGDTHDSLPMLCSAAMFFALQNKEIELMQIVNVLSEIAAETGNNEALASLTFALGESAMLNQDLDEAVKQFSQSYHYFEKLAVPIEQLRAAFRLGIAHAINAAPKSAVHYLNAALRIARNLGCRPFAALITEKMHAFGFTAEEPHAEEGEERATRGGLTRRQIEIAKHIAQGLTNKQIAKKLYLSPRTVEMHVANLMNRLDCRTRSEAVHKMGELGLMDE